MRCPSLFFGTVVILSTMSRERALRPLRSFDAIGTRNNGASQKVQVTTCYLKCEASVPAMVVGIVPSLRSIAGRVGELAEHLRDRGRAASNGRLVAWAVAEASPADAGTR